VVESVAVGEDADYRPRGISRADVVLVVVASLAFATSGPLGKAAGGVSAILVASARTGIAAIVLALLDVPGLIRAVRGLERKQRLGVLIAGALLGAHFALFLGGLVATSLAAAVALVALEPIAVVLAAFVAFRLRPTRREMLGLVVSTIGAFVVASSAGVGEHRLSGDLMVLGAVVLFGAYVAAARGLRDAMPPNPYAASVYGTSSLLLLPVALFLPSSSGMSTTSTITTGAITTGAITTGAITTGTITTSTITTNSLLAVLGLALIPTLIGHTLVQRAARHAPPVLVALVCPGETIGALALGAILLGTLPTPREAVGAAIVLCGATLAITGGRPIATPTAPPRNEPRK
jgi:drug/metabolite transporter (DMT)-like permease